MARLDSDPLHMSAYVDGIFGGSENVCARISHLQLWTSIAMAATEPPLSRLCRIINEGLLKL